MYSCAALLFSGRFYSIQVAEHTKYLKLSDTNRIRVFFSSNNRGKILDDNNIEIATTKKFYNIICDPKSITEFDKIIELLSTMLCLSDNEISSLQKKIETMKNFFHSER